MANRDKGTIDTPFDMLGNYRKREELKDSPIPYLVKVINLTATFHQACNLNERTVTGRDVEPKKIDYESLRMYLL